jgi:hypothetical protein
LATVDDLLVRFGFGIPVNLQLPVFWTGNGRAGIWLGALLLSLATKRLYGRLLRRRLEMERGAPLAPFGLLGLVEGLPRPLPLQLAPARQP